MPPAIQYSPCSKSKKIPAVIVPTKMAIKVPISTKALPPTSSSSSSCCGNSANLTGPKREDCSPIKNSNNIIIQTLPITIAAAAKPMMMTSSPFTHLISFDFSNLSAICPAIGENKKNGKMNKPAAKLVSKAESLCALIPPNAINNNNAFLYKLSLNAPKAWVRK